MMDERNDLIKLYFQIGLTQREMLISLAHQGYHISLRKLQQCLATLNLYRRKNYSELTDVITFMRTQMTGSGRLHGYRWMWNKCIQHGLYVRRDHVQSLLQMIDPISTEYRLSRRLNRRRYYAPGPGFIWHIDGNDKLVPYGFGIHGAIDGFSRYVIWLNVYYTNKQPDLVAGYFVDAIEQHGCACPKLIRADEGTENVTVEIIQEAMMGNGSNGLHHAYIKGSSKLNQRIEYLWAHLRKECLEFWMAMFHDMKERGTFTGDFIDQEILRFCFMAIIQDDLDACMATWNNHRIRKSRVDTVSGKPAVMYHAPEVYNTVSYLTSVSHADVNALKQTCPKRECTPCDPDIFQLCCILMTRLSLTSPRTPEAALNTYFTLRAQVRRMKEQYN